MSLIEAPRNSDWTGCIDFGTAMSKAAVVRRKLRKSLMSADVAALAIGERDGVASRNRLLLPSIIYMTDQAVLFGEEAQTAAIRGERLGACPSIRDHRFLGEFDSVKAAIRSRTFHC
jgi:hypothetical protein